MRKPAYQTKVVLGDAMRRHLEAGAKADGRSIADEIRQRLERTFEQDARAAKTNALLTLIAELAAELQRLCGAHWFEQSSAYDAFSAGVGLLLATGAGEAVDAPWAIQDTDAPSAGRVIARMLVKRAIEEGKLRPRKDGKS